MIIIPQLRGEHRHSYLVALAGVASPNFAVLSSFRVSRFRFASGYVALKSRHSAVGTLAAYSGRR
jgi:hypothetical protein